MPPVQSVATEISSPNPLEAIEPGSSIIWLQSILSVENVHEPDKSILSVCWLQEKQSKENESNAAAFILSNFEFTNYFTDGKIMHKPESQNVVFSEKDVIFSSFNI